MNLKYLIQVHFPDDHLNISLDGGELETAAAPADRYHRCNHCAEPRTINVSQFAQIQDQPGGIFLQVLEDGKLERGNTRPAGKCPLQMKDRYRAPCFVGDGHASIAMGASCVVDFDLKSSYSLSSSLTTQMPTTNRQKAVRTLLKPPAVRYLRKLKKSIKLEPDYLTLHQADVGNIVIGFLAGSGFQWHRKIFEREWPAILREALDQLPDPKR